MLEPDSTIEVRLHDRVAVIRYRSNIDLVVFGERFSLKAWHTDLYEWRKDRRQVVWSQATEIVNVGQEFAER